MNALTVEEAFKAAAAAIYSPLAGFCGTSGDVLPNEDPVVVFLCEECEHKAGPYWTALLRIEVDAPALTGEGLPLYSSTWTDLLTWLDAPLTVEEEFPVSGVDLNGYFVLNSGQALRDNRWIGSIVIRAGVAKSA